MLIDFSQATLYYPIGCIIFNPIFWNIVARREYRTHFLTKLAGGNAKYGCYALAATIFSLGIVRDYFYAEALKDQPTHPLLELQLVQALAFILFLVGNTLVLSSMWALGVTGTYLGDYFGILMKERVSGFPFNVCDNPMYIGSTFSFLGTALWYGRPAGILLTFFVYVMYKFALKYEEPFTKEIYESQQTKKE